MRLIHITTVPFTFRFFHGQIAFLKSRGVEVHAVSSPGDELGTLQEVEQREVIEVHPVRMQRRISPVGDLLSLWHLWRLLRRLRPDIVHSHTPKAALLGTLAARAVGTKVVLISIFGMRQMTKAGLSRRLLDWTTRLSCRLADRVWCDSFSIRDCIVAEGLCAPEKTVILGQGSVMGVDAREHFSPSRCGPDVRRVVRTTYGIPPDATVLGFVGRNAADKGMRELASAWRNLRNRYLSLHLMLVGPSDSTDPISPDDTALFRADERVHLCGYCEDLPAHLAAMDVFAMPSYREGFGIVNIEAGAMGLPVVSTRIPGCVDSVQDGVTGTLVPPRDANALKDAIAHYLEDPSLRERHGQAGRQRALQEFRPEAIWESLYHLYIDLVERGVAFRLGASAVGDAVARSQGSGGSVE
jgi:glycosyltransferase involved in cell wall biosynthesis